ncbi:amino acid permease, partial [Candidatus Woesearchaeota archaeon]|nr:amino acid permease [Candidatus Woesearchaeota archaeon]
SEETKNPTKTIPRAVILSIIITSILYVLVAVSAVSVIGWENLSSSKAPLADVAKAAFGSTAFLILGLIALASTANTVLMALLVTSRTIYGMSEEKSLPKKLSIVHSKRRTPWLAILLTLVFAAAFALIRNLEFVANLSNIFIFLTFAIINLSVIVLRYKKPNASRKFRVPLNIGKFPVLIFLGIIVSLFMLYYSVVNAFFAI